MKYGKYILNDLIRRIMLLKDVLKEDLCIEALDWLFMPRSLENNKGKILEKIYYFPAIIDRLNVYNSSFSIEFRQEFINTFGFKPPYVKESVKWWLNSIKTFIELVALR